MRLAVLLLSLALTLAGCGKGSTDSSGGPPPPAPPPTPDTSTTDTNTDTSTTDSGIADSCSQFCEQAGATGGGGDGAGTTPSDSSRSAGEVLPCGSQQCVTQITTSADVTNGVVPIELRCDAQVTCNGAIVVYISISSRLGGADFSIGPGEISTVDVQLVDNWQELIQQDINARPEDANYGPPTDTFIWLVGPGNEALIGSGAQLSLTPAP